jgi:hypothetical protein
MEAAWTPSLKRTIAARFLGAMALRSDQHYVQLEGPRNMENETVASAEPIRPHNVPREPLLAWLARNVLRLTVYLLVASFVLPLYSIVTDGGADGLDYVGLGTLYTLYGGVYGLPGTAAWLMILAYLPPEWSTFRRRALALALSPLIQVFWLAFFVSIGYRLAALVFGLLLPAGAAFVLRLRERRASSP